MSGGFLDKIGGGRHMEQHDLNSLEAKIDKLLAVCYKLADENKVLRAENANLIAERTALHEKTVEARSRVESILQRLKTLDPEAQP